MKTFSLQSYQLISRYI